MRTILVCISLASIATVTLHATTAQAQDNAATVEALFADGKRLMAEGKTAEACPKFLASYNLEHRVGTVLNLASCYEKNGQLASAWARFVDARTLATRANQAERAAFADEHASALEPRRSMLTIVVEQPSPGLVVRRDGVVVDPAAYGVAVPVDGGPHTIEAAAPDKKAVTSTVTVKGEADRKSFTLPPLLDAPPTARAEPSATPSSPPPQRISTRTVLGLGIAGVGVVAAGVGVVFGIQALSKNSESNTNGDCTGNLCNKPGFDARTSARSSGDIASVLIGAGAAALVGGGLLWLTAPKGGASRASAGHVVVGVGPAGLEVRGVF